MSVIRHKADPVIFKGYQEVELDKKAILEIWSNGGLQVIGAPGAGRVNVVRRVIMTIDPDSDNFAGSDTSVILEYSGGANIAVAADGFLAETSRHSSQLAIIAYSGSPVLSTNEAVQLSLVQGLTSGGSDSKLTVQVWYDIMPAA